MRKEILLAGLGWIAAGIISISGWLIETSSNACQCSPANLLYTGIVVVLIGVALLILNKRIEEIRAKILQKQRKRSK